MGFIKNRLKAIEAVWLIGVKYPLCVQKPYRVRSVVSRSVLKSTRRLIIDKGCKLPSKIELGSELFMGPNVQVGSSCRKIGAYSSIAEDVVICPGSHPVDRFSSSPYFYSKKRKFVDKSTHQPQNKDTVIDADVWIGSRAMVMQGVHVGVGAIIAAGAVVTKDVEPYAIVGGVPAKLIKYRFDKDKRRALLDSHWWELEQEELRIFYNKQQELKD